MQAREALQSRYTQFWGGFDPRLQQLKGCQVSAVDWRLSEQFAGPTAFSPAAQSAPFPLVRSGLLPLGPGSRPWHPGRGKVPVAVALPIHSHRLHTSGFNPTPVFCTHFPHPRCSFLVSLLDGAISSRSLLVRAFSRSLDTGTF